MKAKDVMTLNVITVDENTSVEDIAATLLKWRISAVPVVDSKERLVGIVSEGDLVHRSESDTDRMPPWWLLNLAQPDESASGYPSALADSAAGYIRINYSHNRYCHHQ